MKMFVVALWIATGIVLCGGYYVLARSQARGATLQGCRDVANQMAPLVIKARSNQNPQIQSPLDNNRPATVTDKEVKLYVGVVDYMVEVFGTAPKLSVSELEALGYNYCVTRSSP